MHAALLTVVIGAALRGAAVLLLAALVTALLRRRSAAVRHATWCFAVGTQLALPALILLAPSWRVPLVATPQWAATADVATEGARDAANDVVRKVQGEAPGATPGFQTHSAEDVIGTLTRLWLLGAGLIILRLAVGTIGVWRLAVRSSRVLDAGWLAQAHELAVRVGISRPLTLLRGESVAVPVTWGIIYPVVLLPADSESWDEEQRRYVLVHEMAHIRRFDALTHLLGQVTLAIFWFNPLVWFAVACMRAEREHACDDYVLRFGTSPSRYANDLLTMIGSIGLPDHRSTGPAFAALAMARRSEFEGRMVAILEDHIPRDPLSRRGIAGGAIATAVVALAIAGFNPLAARDTGTTAAVAQRAPTPVSVIAKAKVRSQDTTRAPRRAEPIDTALASLRPGGAKTAILAHYARSGNDRLLWTAITTVPSLPDDGQKSVVLAHAAPGALGRGDARLRNAFFAAVESITSDGAKSLVLAHAAQNGNASPAVTALVLRAAATMRASGPTSTVLMNVAARRLVTADSLRVLYVRVANSLAADTDRENVLTALLMATPQSSSPDR